MRLAPAESRRLGGVAAHLTATVTCGTKCPGRGCQRGRHPCREKLLLLLLLGHMRDRNTTCMHETHAESIQADVVTLLLTQTICPSSNPHCICSASSTSYYLCPLKNIFFLSSSHLPLISITVSFHPNLWSGCAIGPELRSLLWVGDDDPAYCLPHN